MARLIGAEMLGNRFAPKQCYFTEDILYKIATSPTVDAVPLDKLCCMLAKYIGFPCNYSPIDEEMANYCGDQCAMDDIDCWKKVLTKWMEEQDAAD